MGRKKTRGLRLRNGVYHIEKRILGVAVCESCKTGNLVEAEAYLARRMDEIRRAKHFGERPQRSWQEAAINYLETKRKRSLKDDAKHLQALDPFIGNLALEKVSMLTLKPFVDHCRNKGLKTKSVNNALQVVRHILNLCAHEWHDVNGLTWLVQAPKIKLFDPRVDAAKPYPLSWTEQQRLFELLPEHLQCMALFKVNTGTREMEVCRLRWEWEIEVPEIGRSVFVIPSELVKNSEDRLVILNDIAWSVIQRQRDKHPEWVFPHGGKPLYRMHNTAWKAAWRDAGLPTGNGVKKGVHNLKHTFGHRLRAAGVSTEDRKVLLGHTNGDITTHYSAAEVGVLLELANRVCSANFGKTSAISLLRRKAA